VGDEECIRHGGWRRSSPVWRLDINGRRAADTAVLDDGGGVVVVTGNRRGLLLNRGREGDVRRYLNRKEKCPRPALTREAERYR
jgi:hypothetical protein